MERQELEARKNAALMEELQKVLDKLDKEALQERIEEMGKKQESNRRSMEQILERSAQQSTQLPPAERVMDERVNFIIDSILKDVITRGTGRRALVLERADIAGKTREYRADRKADGCAPVERETKHDKEYDANHADRHRAASKRGDGA